MDTPINPKNYASFDAYMKALKDAKEFEKKTKLVDGVFSRSETEDDVWSGLKEIGFEYYEDELCGREFCERHEMCLSTILDDIESSANDCIFSGLLVDRDRIFPRS